ncbi:MAG: 50S ribosomal protein L11 methyltransferase, partial [Bacteroidota bacterium]
MPNTNWNEEWESNFEPVRLGTSLGLRAPFHEPMGGVDLELVMMPKMSFGTGHHETTLLMSWWLLGAPTEQTIQIGQKVLWEFGPHRVETVEGLLLHQNSTQDAFLPRLKGIRVLDMGCRTGILGRLA